MWEVEVNAISVTSGHLTGAAVSPAKPGIPNGGRIALGRKRGLTSNHAGTSKHAMDANEFTLEDEEGSPSKRVDEVIEKRRNPDADSENTPLDKDTAPVSLGKRPRRG